MRAVRWILVGIMLVVAVSGYAQHTSGVAIEPTAGGPAMEPSEAGTSTESSPPGAAIADDPGAAIATSANRSRQSGKRILWDLTHGEYEGYKFSIMYSSLVTMLTDDGYTVATTTAGLASVDLSQYDILVLSLGSAWYSAYTAAEVNIIKDFVADGGGLLIMGDNDMCPNGNLNPVVSTFGTTLGGMGIDLAISDFMPHPLFAGMDALTISVGGALSAVPPSVTAAWDSSGSGVVNVAGYGKGRVVAIGDFNLWGNSHLSITDNSQFARNVFDWLSFPQKRVLWDLTHGVVSGYEPAGEYSSLATILSAYGHAVETTAAGLASVDLSQYDCLVLNVASAWTSAYTAGEVTLITDFVLAGGGVVVMGDYPGTPNGNLNPVATAFGTTLGVDYLDDTISNHLSHPVFAGVGSLSLDFAGQMAAAPPSEKAAWDSLGRGAVNVAGYGYGRVVAIGDVNLWENACLGNADNSRFATNVFQWIDNRAPSLSTGAFEPSDPAAYGPGTEFRFFVYHYDGDGDAPSVIRVFVDGVAHAMSLANGAPSGGFYEYRTTLPTGAHDYYFYAEDGVGGTDRLPDVNRLAGPFVCRATINDNAAWTASPSVNVRVWGKGAANVHLKNRYTITWQGHFAYAPSSAPSVVIPWTLGAGADGPRAVYAMCTTSKGRPSNISADTICLDTTAPPVIKSCSINNRAATTTSRAVTVKVFVDCATDVRFKNTYAGSWSAWQPLSQCTVGEFGWTLAVGADGPRAVYVQARDHHGYVSNVRCDTIELNTGG